MTDEDDIAIQSMSIAGRQFCLRQTREMSWYRVEGYFRGEVELEKLEKVSRVITPINYV